MLLLPLILAAAVTATPTPGYADALATAERYEKQFNDFRMNQFYAVVGPALEGVTRKCAPGPVTEERAFILVVGYAGGRFAKVETDNGDPAAACFAAELSKLDYPAPPVDDFAEELEMHLMPDGAAPPENPVKAGKH